MTKIPKISGKEMCKIIEKLVFEKVQGKGSHVRYKHNDVRRTVIPIHGNEDLGPGLTLAILKQIGLTRQEFEKL
ncbi:type II toxin-antitoxin system HicA family toxin [Candidatus Pacearchaeota archaeon]|nr:type II toxin-antitoxin system HicA family toxin [Candidatus Pacearchaeota archaeon]